MCNCHTQVTRPHLWFSDIHSSIIPLRDSPPFVVTLLGFDIRSMSVLLSKRQTRYWHWSISIVGTSALLLGCSAFSVNEDTTHVPIAWCRFASLFLTFVSTVVVPPSDSFSLGHSLAS